jgi:hypothetical protein
MAKTTKDKDFLDKITFELLNKENWTKLFKLFVQTAVIPTKESLPDSFAWTGFYKSFECAGFKIADRSSKNRPMVGYYTDKDL